MNLLGVAVMFVFAVIARVIQTRGRLRQRMIAQLSGTLARMELAEGLPLEKAADPWAGEDWAQYGVFGDERKRSATTGLTNPRLS
jgi:hypothetical protein